MSTATMTRGSVGREADTIRSFLERARVVAMVGASPDPWRPSYGIMRYLQLSGYRVIPVNPMHAGKDLHGEPILATLADAGPVDLVNVFRRSDAIDAVVDEAIAAGAPAIWTQLGIDNEPALERARQAGVKVVSNRCISVEHGRLTQAVL